jgi:hypothetical protein
VISYIAALGVVGASMFLFGLRSRIGAPAAALARPVPRRRPRNGALHLGDLESQQVAFQIAMLSSFLPTIMLSGFIYRFRACRSRCSW